MLSPSARVSATNGCFKLERSPSVSSLSMSPVFSPPAVPFHGNMTGSPSVSSVTSSRERLCGVVGVVCIVPAVSGPASSRSGSVAKLMHAATVTGHPAASSADRSRK